MATARDVVDGALKLLRRTGASGTASNEDAADCLTILNDLMASWASKGVDVNHYELELETPFSLDDKHVRGVKALLAVEVAAAFGVAEVPPYVARQAADGWVALCGDFFTVPEATFDTALVQAPSNRYVG
jgi:hypothetical protein